MDVTKRQFMDYIDGWENEDLYVAVIKNYGMTWQKMVETFGEVNEQRYWVLSKRSGMFEWGKSQKFVRKYSEEVWGLVFYQSEELGQGALEMIESFGVCRDSGFDRKSIVKGMVFSDSEERELLFDHLAIYALEETARFVTDVIQQIKEDAGNE